MTTSSKYSWLGVATTVTLTILIGLIALAEFLDGSDPNNVSQETESERKKSVPLTKRQFIPSFEWQVVEDDHVLPRGMEIKINVTTGEKLARIPPERVPVGK